VTIRVVGERPVGADQYGPWTLLLLCLDGEWRVAQALDWGLLEEGSVGERAAWHWQVTLDRYGSDEAAARERFLSFESP
jgi:hypothetical protein